MSRLIYGINPIFEALKAGIKIKKIYITERKMRKELEEILEKANSLSISVENIDNSEMKKMTSSKVHQGIVALVEDFKFATLESVIEKSKLKNRNIFFLILDSIEDPHNLGALIRTAEGAGLDGVILPKDRSAPINATVSKVSAGAIEHIPIIQVVNLAYTIDKLKKLGIWIFGSDSICKQSIYSLDLKCDLGIVIGSEGKGIRPLIKKKCDLLFSIPLFGKVSSLNASVAGGIIIYEVIRQRLLEA